MKKIKQHELRRIDYDGPLNEVIERLQKLKEDYSEYENLEIIEESCYDGGYYYNLFGYKLETDAEEQSREEREAQSEATQREYQRRQYEALKAIFESTP